MYSIREREKNKLLRVLNSIDLELNKLESISYNYKYNKTYKLIEFIKSNVEDTRKSILELENPFLLSIIGCGNYGKSTFINALLSENFIKTSILPNTWLVTSFIDSRKNYSEIVYEQDTFKKSIQSTKDILDKESKLIYKSKKNISNEILKFQKMNREDKNAVLKFKEDKQKNQYNSPIKEVKYYIKDKEILKDFIIVDTPGINQTLLRSTKLRIQNYYLKCDGIILILDSQNINAKSTIDFIKTIESMNNKNNKHILAVINKIDLINEKDYTNICEYIKKQYGYLFKDTIFISAKNILNNKDTLRLNQLIKSINKNFKYENEILQIKSKQENMIIMKNTILKEIDIFIRRFLTDISLYNEELLKIKYNLQPRDEMDITILNKNLESKYVEYKNYKKQIEYLNNIEKILKRYEVNV